jgi:hypothetical protein
VTGTQNGTTPAAATLRNVDFHGNVADTGSGAVINSMRATLTNVTLMSTVTYANSVMLGRCVGDPARFVPARNQKKGPAMPGLFVLHRYAAITRC